MNRTVIRIRIAALFVGALLPLGAAAQGPPPPPALTPLNPPPVPAGNPVTQAKVDLGKALFWDEQLSSTRTISCGTCHQPSAGGADPRSERGLAESTHPGPDGILGTSDDVVGSPGVVLNQADGTYSLDDFFGMASQVTGRYTPPAINAGYANQLFWDGRAGETFLDPITNEVILSDGAALETQAAGPPLSDVEMAHQGRDWSRIATRIAGSKPLALADSIPGALADWIADRSYPALFNEAFGSSEVTAARIIMAIATYERILVSNQAPIDAFIAGDTDALTAQQQQGLQMFNGRGRCAACHGGHRFTDDRFHYIGVRPQDEDLGRFHVTGRNRDRGEMKTPSLRNVSLRNSFMHNGRFDSLADVVNFYNRGGDFDAANKSGLISPLGLDATERAALVAFLESLTDPRVAAESAPFDRPAMYAVSGHVPSLDGNSVPGSGNVAPRMVAIEPPLRGNPNFTLGVAGGLGGANAFLAIADAPLPTNPGAIDQSSVRMRFDLDLAGSGAGNGFASVPIALSGDAALDGRTLHARWYVTDGSAANGFAVSESATFFLFGESAGLVPAPTNLTATDGAFGGRVDLNWSPVTDAVAYEVYRGPTSNFGNATRLGATSGTSFSDNGATADQVFHYFVFAVTETEAGPTATDTGFGTDGAPEPVLNLTATDGSRTDAVALNWSDVDGANLYRIFRASSDDRNSASEVGSTTNTSFLDATAPPETTFFYWVKYEIDADTEGFSSSDSGWRAAAEEPPAASLDAPGFLAATGTESAAITFSWNGVAGADEYLVFRGTSDNETHATLLTTTGSNSITDAGAAFDTILFYWVQARRSSDGAVSDLAGPVTGWRPDNGDDSPPTDGGGNGGSGSGIQTPGEVAESPAETETGYSSDLAGRYFGLIHDAGASDSETLLNGSVGATVTHLRRADLGVATLVFTYEGRRYRTRAVATENGELIGGFTKRDDDRSAMSFLLHFVETDAGRKLVGELSGDGRTSLVELCQRSLHPRHNPAEIAGRYTLVMPGTPDADTALLPGGDGAAVGRIALNGIGRFVGWLGDGTPISFVAFSGPDQELMFYRPVYAGTARGWIGGKLTFREITDISDADGMLHWVKNANHRQRRYAEGFDLQQEAVLSVYERPVPRDGRFFVLDTFPDESNNGLLSLAGAGLSTGLDTERIDWNRGNRFRYDTEQFRIFGRAVPGTGCFKGVCIDQENRTRLPFRGVAFQKQDLVTGTLRGPDSTGFISVEANPALLR